jgi:hypothetical protein
MKAVRLGVGEALQVVGQLWHDVRRERDRAGTGARLRVAVDEPPVVHLRYGGIHPNLADIEIHLIPAQPGQLAEAQVREGGQEQDQRPGSRQRAGLGGQMWPSQGRGAGCGGLVITERGQEGVVEPGSPRVT